MTKPDKALFSEVSPFQSGGQYQPGDWKKISEIVHDAENIKGFFGEYRWLSSFGAAIVMLDDVKYEGVERAYQAAKWRPEDRAYFIGCSNEEAITYNRERDPNLYSPPEWDARKLNIMRLFQVQKYDPDLNPENTSRLIGTGNRYLEETNWWGDTYWGKDLTGEGENHLGKLIMEVRAGLLER